MARELESRSAFLHVDSGKQDAQGMNIYKTKTVGKLVGDVDPNKFVTVMDAISGVLQNNTNGVRSTKSLYECTVD